MTMLTARRSLGCAHAVLLLFCAGLSACSRPQPTEVEVKVRSVGFDPRSQSPVVVLEDTERQRALPIWIGENEAQAIAMQIEGVKPPRPMTHDLIKTMLEKSGVELRKVIITEIKDSTYHARIHLDAETGRQEIDSRPSDAIAIALRFAKPIFVATSLFGEGRSIDLGKGDLLSSVSVGEVSVQAVTEDLAEHFGLRPGQGVLVSAASETSGLRSGDVVLEVDGRSVNGVAEFSARVRGAQPGSTLPLRIRRGGKRLDVQMRLPPG
jgi:bifunctional DNase/RNase